MNLKIQASRNKRLMQLSFACFVAIIVAGLVGSGVTQKILLLSSIGLAFAGLSAYMKRTYLSSTLLLVSLTSMLSMLVWVSGGIRDIGMLGYPMILMLAAMLGNKRLLMGILSAILVYCAVITVMTVNGQFEVVLPTVTLTHFVYVAAIFVITALGAYWLTTDSRKLMTKLRSEHHKTLRREKTITELANCDQLTGLHNRRFLEQNFDGFVRDAYRSGHKVAIFFVDLDAFKPVNDSLSHTAGDQVLIAVAQRMKAISSSTDLICRFGGDEFLLIRTFNEHPGERKTRELEEFAQTLLGEIKRPYIVLDTKVEISASIGIAVVPEHGRKFLDLVRSADLAMYDAKDKGRNTYSLYSSDLKEANLDRFQLMKDMREALKNDGFEVWYQPKMDIKSLQIIGCESLVRWPKPDGTYIYPDQFIPIAESSGLINELGAWVLERACLDCVKWRSEGFADVKVAVNVSYIQLREGKLPERIQETLDKTGLPAEALEIELTESLFVADDENIQKQIDVISEMGVSLAIDDFGTGYSNLGYLRRFNARCLKIDRSFISAMGESSRDEPLVKAIIQMSHSLGLKVIAEGIEGEDSLRKLHELGCDEGQGFLWSPAMPIAKWNDYMKKNIPGLPKAASN